jgi:MFS family permease
MKNRKSFILIITSIPIIVSIFLGFYVFENGWRPDRFYNGIKGIDWIMITAIILIILLMAFIIISFLLNKKKAFKMIIKLYPPNYKRQSKILVLSLIFLVFSIILVLYTLSIPSILLFSSVAGNCVLTILPLYFINGLYENGVMHSGMFHSWDDIISHNYKHDNIIAFEIENMFKERRELKFFFKSISCNEIDEIIRRSI